MQRCALHLRRDAALIRGPGSPEQRCALHRARDTVEFSHGIKRPSGITRGPDGLSGLVPMADRFPSHFDQDRGGTLAKD
jgi:hypothetical protein